MSKPDWTFNGTWRYEPRWFGSPDGRLHYIDEGPSDATPMVMVHGNPAWGYMYRTLLGELEDGLERHFQDKPVGIAWGMKDAAFTPAILEELWPGTFPHATVTRVPDAGHFVQEDAYERVVPVLLDHLGHSSRSAGVSANGQTK